MKLFANLTAIISIVFAFSSCINEAYDLENLNTEMNVVPGITVPLDYEFTLDGDALGRGIKTSSIEAGDTLAFNVNKTINFGDVMPDILDLSDALVDIAFNGYNTFPLHLVVKVESLGFKALNDFELEIGSKSSPSLSNALMSLRSAISKADEATKAKIGLTILVINDTEETVNLDKDMVLHVASESITFTEGVNIKL